MNLFPVELSGAGVSVAGTMLSGTGPAVETLGGSDSRNILMGVRAEKIQVAAHGDDPASIPAAVALVEHLGAETIVGFKLGKEADTTSVGGSTYRNLHFARLPGDADFSHGQPCYVTFDLVGVSWFEADTGVRVEQE